MASSGKRTRFCPTGLEVWFSMISTHHQIVWKTLDGFKPTWIEMKDRPELGQNGPACLCLHAFLDQWPPWTLCVSDQLLSLRYKTASPLHHQCCGDLKTIWFNPLTIQLRTEVEMRTESEKKDRNRSSMPRGEYAG